MRKPTPEMQAVIDRFETAVMAKIAIGSIPNEPIQKEYEESKAELEICMSYVP